MATINTGLNEKGIRGIFNQAHAEVQQALLYPRVTTRVKSTSDNETYRWLGMAPSPRVFGSVRIAKDLRSESYNIVNEKYEATLAIDRDEIDDAQLSLIPGRIRELAQRAELHKDFLLATLYSVGSVAGNLAYDGQVFWSASHEWVTGDGTSQDNTTTTSITDANVPTVAECKTAVSNAIEAMWAFVDDEGKPLMPPTSSLRVVCPANMFFNMREAIDPTAQDTTKLFVGLNVSVVMFPMLTAVDSSQDERFYVIRSGSAVGSAIWQDRMPTEFGSFTAQNDREAFNTEKYLYGVRARYKMAYGRWTEAVRHIFT